MCRCSRYANTVAGSCLIFCTECAAAWLVEVSSVCQGCVILLEHKRCHVHFKHLLKFKLQLHVFCFVWSIISYCCEAKLGFKWKHNRWVTGQNGAELRWERWCRWCIPLGDSKHRPKPTKRPSIHRGPIRPWDLNPNYPLKHTLLFHRARKLTPNCHLEYSIRFLEL